MQFGIFTIGDVTTDPTTGRVPTENERIKNTVEMAPNYDGKTTEPTVLPSRSCSSVSAESSDALATRPSSGSSSPRSRC